MLDEKLRQEIASEAMAGLLSNSHLTKLILKTLGKSGLPKKDNKYFKVIASFSCISADELIKRLDKI